MEGPRESGATRGVVAAPLYCRRCGYNLFGLKADGSCPECGLEVWETILHTVDPAASHLPKLRNPAAVGNALLWLVICMVAAVLLLAVRPVAVWIDDLDKSGVRDLSVWTPVELAFGSGLAALAALWSVWRFGPPRGADAGGAVRRGVGLLGAGLLGWTVLAIAATGLEVAGAPGWQVIAVRLALAGTGIVALLGLRDVLGVIGLRSRSYRTARGGRQGLLAMVAALAGVAAGQGVNLIAYAAGGARYLATMGTVVIAISTLMLLIGLVYLAVNAWWIRRSLLRPPPRWDEILREEEA